MNGQDGIDEAYRLHKNYFQHFLENQVRIRLHGIILPPRMIDLRMKYRMPIIRKR